MLHDALRVGTIGTVRALMDESRIQAVDHVNLEAPNGREEGLRWFYGEVAQLEEVASDGADPLRLCFKSGQIELRVHCVPSPRVEPIECRATVFVDSLATAVEQLEERRVPFTRLSGLLYSDRRVEVHDPAGNRVALKQSSHLGLL